MDKSIKIFPDIYTNKSFDERNQTLLAPLCHVPSETEKELRKQLIFWLDGVAKTLVALQCIGGSLFECFSCIYIE